MQEINKNSKFDEVRSKYASEFILWKRVTILFGPEFAKGMVTANSYRDSVTMHYKIISFDLYHVISDFHCRKLGTLITFKAEMNSLKSIFFCDKYEVWNIKYIKCSKNIDVSFEVLESSSYCDKNETNAMRE